MTLRSLALANAIMRLFGAASSFPLFMLRHPLLRVLEVNPAGTLHRALRRMPRAVTTHYPEVDMTALPFSDESFDLVVHSDTLEHVPDPVRGLAECLRVVRRRGWVCFTVPVIVERLTRARSGLPPSFHGGPQAGDPGYLVHTEYGADMWTHAMEAGASDCRILALDYPSAMAIAARR
jgi:SAM-dependent methyltransferase